MNTHPSVTYELVPRQELSNTHKREMFALLTRHFTGVTPEQFARDLAEKNLALLLQKGPEVVGFSTLQAYSTFFEKERVNIVYSGDTIVAPEAWGTTALPRAWVAGVDTLRASLPTGRCFWLLLTSGFRTYRFLPVFWNEFFPRFDRPTPVSAQRILQALATERFGEQFDPETGVVRFTHPQRLRHELQEVSRGRERDPHIAFFLSRNPGHGSGDELVCLTELTTANLTRAGRRMNNPQPDAAISAHC
jgi:hypothetical protein